MEITNPECPKSQSNNTDINKTDISETEIKQSYPITSGNSKRKKDVMEEMRAYREVIHENIDYQYHAKEDVDELVELIIEVMMMPEDSMIRIAGVEKPVAERMNLEADRVHRMILMGVKYLAKPQYIIYVVEGLENHNRNLVVQKERSIENAKRLHPDLPENILEEPISFLKFNTRIYNALKRHKVDTVGDLLDALRLPKWIQSLSNIGEQSQREIVQKMESLGLADNSYAAVRNIKFR